MEVTDQECHVIESVEENKEGFTQRDVNQAKHARELHTMCIKPTVQNLKHLISGNFVKNCPIMVEDVTIAEHIFGPDVATLKGKSARRRPPTVRQDSIKVPEEILRLNKDIIMYIDNMFINRLPFLSTHDNRIKYVKTVPIKIEPPKNSTRHLTKS